MKFYLALAISVSLLNAQTPVPAQHTIPAGTQREILLQIPAPRHGDMIDILAADAKVRITVVLPDGREATESTARQLGVSWEIVSAAALRAADKNLASALLAGQGQHTVLEFREKPLPGDYRIHIDTNQATATARVLAAYIPIANLLMKWLQDCSHSSGRRHPRFASSLRGP